VVLGVLNYNPEVVCVDKIRNPDQLIIELDSLLVVRKETKEIQPKTQTNALSLSEDIGYSG
jgi:hypothetical protein